MKNSLSLICTKFQYAGGMERYLIDLVKGFNQISIFPDVYATKFDAKLEEYSLINPILINLSFIPKPLRTHFFSYYLNKHKKQNQISISTSYTISDVIICGGNHQGYLNALNKRPTFSDKLKIRNEARVLAQSKLVIAHSKMMKEELIRFYHTDEDKIKDKIKIVYPPINTEKFSIPTEEKRNELRKKFGFSENEAIYLFPSTGHSRKGFDILKSYFEKSHLPIRLVVAGTPVKESKNIRSLGFCKNMDELYQASDYTILASNYEPFGLVGLESILSGTPIVFADNIGCLEVLQNNFGYTFSRENKNSLDLAINQSIETKHRIHEPFKCINYDPSLSHHMTQLLKYIEKL